MSSYEPGERARTPPPEPDIFFRDDDERTVTGGAYYTSSAAATPACGSGGGWLSALFSSVVNNVFVPAAAAASAAASETFDDHDLGTDEMHDLHIFAHAASASMARIVHDVVILNAMPLVASMPSSHSHVDSIIRVEVKPVRLFRA